MVNPTKDFEHSERTSIPVFYHAAKDLEIICPEGSTYAAFYNHSLMIAFTADYCSGDITINSGEIEEAGWYKYDNLPGRPQTSVSIATKLIDSFINSYN